jgi:beta-aspartyl-peptidase (threonine type)
MPHYVLAIHGGAGTIDPGADEAPYHAALLRALGAGQAVLEANGSAMDAVTAAVLALEDCTLFNAGRGSVYTAGATHEMDAIVMDGASLRAGAVAGVSTVEHPVLLARAVMEQTPCVLLAGAGAEQFAREAGFEAMAPEFFATDARLAQLRRAQADGKIALDHTAAIAPINEDSKFGTVGAVALDRHGNLASAVSTGGMTNKRIGRIGDTPIVGAGCYADNASVAVAATGTGEHFMRAVLAYDIAARMAYGGASLEQAAGAAVHGKLSSLGGEGGVIAIGKDGALAMPFNTTGMYRACVRESEAGASFIF